MAADCEGKFEFDDNGGIDGVDVEACETIRLLKLDHATLEGWRRGAIAAFFPPELKLTRKELHQLVEKL